MRTLFAFVSITSLLAPPAPTYRAPAAERIALNDNRVAAGVLRNGVLTVSLEAREGEWRPDGTAGPTIVVRAFAERGKALTAPGPMIRVPEGTTIHASVTNSLSRTLVVHGLAARGVAGPDTTTISAGATRDVRFTAGAPGTYFYRGVTSDSADGGPTKDAVLAGAFIVDPRGAAPPRDRVLLISLWSGNPLPGGLVPGPTPLRFTINGASWPNTERLTYDVGDTVSFRVINASIGVHPMHLHGFYFDVNSRGGAAVDTVYAKESPPYRVVTERAAAGRTFTMTWVPERTGNWLFHCHDNYHVLRNYPLDGSTQTPEHLLHVTNHATDMMGGLVMGIEVRGREAPSVFVAEEQRRRLRLVAQQDAGGTDANPHYGYTLQDGTKRTPTASPLLPGPVILLKRGEPVAITVANRLREATAVHWHGIELESYFDGVADFSGTRARIAHAIAPNDSFVAHFTPPRSGTFMYHPHADEVRQQQAGLTGALVVVDDPATFDPVHDILLLITVPRSDADAGSVLVNGSLTPPPLELKVGERYRLRLINVHTFRPSMIARVLRDSSLVTWRAIAKDGMDLPAERAVVRPAIQQMGNGETFDFEFTPTQAGDLLFTVRAAIGTLLATMPIRIR